MPGSSRTTGEAPRDIPGCHGVSPSMIWISSIIQLATREGTCGVPCVSALEGAHFGLATHLWGPFPACTVGYNALKAIQPLKKHRHGAGHQHFRMGIMPQGQVLQHLSPRHPDGFQGHRTEVSPWLWLPWHYMANISYAGKSRAGHPNLAHPCANSHSSSPPGMWQVPWGATNPPRAARGVSGPRAGSGAGLGTVSCSGVRSCAHLDFSRLRSTSLLNQMAKINK